MTNQRPDPDALLARVRDEEHRTARTTENLLRIRGWRWQDVRNAVGCAAERPGRTSSSATSSRTAGLKPKLAKRSRDAACCSSQLIAAHRYTSSIWTRRWSGDAPLHSFGG